MGKLSDESLFVEYSITIQAGADLPLAAHDGRSIHEMGIWRHRRQCFVEVASQFCLHMR